MPQPESDIIRPGPECHAWAQLREDGTANVHVVRPGRPAITILGVKVYPVRRNAMEAKKGGE
jgi:hypothetical protein